jgi:hypothetical protein
LVEAVTVALVSPFFTYDVTSTTSRSTPLMLLMPPVSWGRSPAFETAVPLFERVELKKFAAGLTVFDSVLPFQASASPLPRLAPAYAIAPTLAS